MLTQIRIILVNTSHPGNIGAAARAMKTMGLSQLYLVDPKLFPSSEASLRASGADDVLENAVICDSLQDALEDPFQLLRLLPKMLDIHSVHCLNSAVEFLKLSQENI